MNIMGGRRVDLYYIVETFVLYARTSGAQERARLVVLCLGGADGGFWKRKINCGTIIIGISGFSIIGTNQFQLRSALIAQLVERVTSNDEVAGSTPS
jgi:hypothetical protein